MNSSDEEHSCWLVTEVVGYLVLAWLFDTYIVEDQEDLFLLVSSLSRFSAQGILSGTSN